MSKYEAIRGHMGRLDDRFRELAYIPFSMVEVSDYPSTTLGAVAPRLVDGTVVIWSDTPIVLDGSHSVEWVTSGERGEVFVHSDGAVDGALPAPLHEVAPLSVLHKKGIEAAWKLSMRLESYLTELVRGASRRVAADVGVMGGVLDDAAVEEVVGDLVSRGKLLEWAKRLATTEKLMTQSMNSYLHINLRSMAETAVRRRIGDPHVGRKVRALFRETKARSMADFLALYHARYPKDAVGQERALAALSAGSLVETNALSFDEAIYEETSEQR